MTSDQLMFRGGVGAGGGGETKSGERVSLVGERLIVAIGTIKLISSGL